MPFMTPSVAQELAELLAAIPRGTPEQQEQICANLTAIANKKILKMNNLTPTQEVILQTIKEYATPKPATQIQCILEAFVNEMQPTRSLRGGRAGR